MSGKLWAGRFDLPTDTFVEQFSAVIHIETRMCQDDIRGSIAHATMLGRQGIITQQDAASIVAGLQQVQHEIETGEFIFRSEDEDIHMAIEKRLTEIIGPTGGRLHTGRSRNDQCAVDGVMHMRRTVREVQIWLRKLQKTFIRKAEQNMAVIMPGYTHLQTAQPVLFAHWIMAYFWMLERDHQRLEALYHHTRFCPLGAAALAGTSFSIDRHFTAQALGFSGPTENSIDSVSNRDFVLEFCAVAAICYMHLTRLAEEMVIYSSQDFRFFELSDDYCTGSSIMPQKKNPDIAELIRGKGGRMSGNLIALLTMMKGLPLSYNKDMMEDKEITFDSMDTLIAGLKIMAPMTEKMTVIAENTACAAARGYSTATDMADYLVRQGIPFREAHHITGQTVNYCIANKKMLQELTLEEFKTIDKRIDADIYAHITLEASVNARRSYGGTAPEAVRRQIENAKKQLALPA